MLATNMRVVVFHGTKPWSRAARLRRKNSICRRPNCSRRRRTWKAQKAQIAASEAAIATATAAVVAAEAAVALAELNLEYTRVSAPIKGRVSRREVTEGISSVAALSSRRF